MIKSMTGFGRSFSSNDENEFQIEIKSVNSRFLEVKFRGYQLEVIIENKILKILENELERGNVQIRIDIKENNKFQSLQFNKDRFESIQEILKNIYVNYGQRLNLSEVISTNDLLKIDDSNLIDEKIVLNVFRKALEQLKEMREVEGQQIYNDIINRIKCLNIMLEKTKGITTRYKEEKLVSLKEKISTLIDDSKIDEFRLIQEIAFLAERADVTEEIVRCESHIKQLSDYLDKNEPVGKRINFLLQEIGREINTLGSKSSQPDATMHVVEMKGELEKIREQIQNIL